MARDIVGRLRLQGTVVARTPLHVGGHGDDVDTDLPLARNGTGQLYVPGTSLAGALRQWCEQAFDPRHRPERGRAPTDRVWGFQTGEDGDASHVLVEDAVIENTDAVVVEVRDGVGIDRWWGTAAEGIKFDRAVLPRGTRLPLCLIAEVAVEADRTLVLAMLAALKVALEDGAVRLGAARTRGLGRVVLADASLTVQELNTRTGILAALRGAGRGAPVPSGSVIEALRSCPPVPQPYLDVTLRWKPAGPLMVKSGFDGIAVDMLPLVSGRDGRIAMVLPGSSVKGAFRAQAERIVRTLLDRERGPRGTFLEDLELPLVNELFGHRGQGKKDARRRPGGPPMDGPLPGLGALGVDDCYGDHSLDRDAWQQIAAARNDLGLRTALEAAGVREWQQAYHVAVDRWTGGAAESFLYSVLEPHRVTWEPLRLGMDLSRLTEADQGPGVALLLLVLRDLAQGRLPLGFATHRGMGAVQVETVELVPHNAGAVLGRLQGTLPGGSLGGLPGQVRADLNAAWQRWIGAQKAGGQT